MADVFSPHGILADRLPGFEYRPQQVRMAQLVEDALTKGRITLIEAGTGTGKSLAYLIPAATFAIRSGKRVVISTNTINLQEQLIHKDIPWVQAEVAPELKAVLVKGWHNYLCLYRYEGVLHSTAELLEPTDEVQLAAVRDWVSRGPKEGSRTELPFAPNPGLWNSICAESDFCLRQKCPFYDHCYLFKARRAVEDAQLIVVNHHLLFADIAVRNVVGWQSEAVLPPYEHVILDEAHHIEDVATEHLGQQFSELGWRQYLGRIFRTGRGNDRRGFIGSLQARLLEVSQNVTPVLEHISGSLMQALERAHRQGSAFVEHLAAWAAARTRPDANETLWAIEHDGEWVSQVLPAADELASALRAVGGSLTTLSGLLRELGEEWEGAALESDALSARGVKQAEAAEWLAAAEDTEHVFWLEASTGAGRRTHYSLRSAPLDVGEKLSQWLNEGLRSAVLCSATLTVGGSFSYILRRLGVAEGGDSDEASSRSWNVCTEAIDSPFDYKRQAALLVPTDIVEPNAPAFNEMFTESLGSVLRASGGRAFVLFTSYSHLKATAAALRPLLEQEGIPLWVHGEASRSHLLSSFLANPGSVLFGTDSFWEGVDVQGSALSLVAIARLPFEVPTHPVAKARAEHLREQGINPFDDYSVPRAALKLKQGFGRLIRSAADRGAVIIYDKRLLTRRYGRVLLASLPAAPCHALTLAELPEMVAAQLAAHDSRPLKS